MKNALKTARKRGHNPNPKIEEAHYWRDRARTRARAAEAKQRQQEQEILRTTSLKDIIH